MLRIVCIAFWISSLTSGSMEIRGDDVPASSSQAPEWIWAAEGGNVETIRFSRSFSLASAPIEGELRIAADFCDVTLQINDATVLELEGFAPTQTLDVTPFLVPGDNHIVLIASPHADPKAVALSLTAKNADGEAIRIVTDESWTTAVHSADDSSPVPARSLGRVAPQMWGIGARSIEITPFDDYEQWRRASGDDATSDSGRFWIREGFEIELVKAADESEGSWVALAFDGPGRLTVAREDRGLLRFTFDELDGHVSRVETIDDELEECRGLVYVGDTLYANANNSRALYRLDDVDGDGNFDERNIIREFPGGVGHGRNCITVDRGALWMICGDSVEVPGDMSNFTSPFREASQGHHSSEGFLARYDLERREWQLYSAGLRNPFGVALNHDGEAFTYDADAEYDMGTPWYRPTRILHLRSGADYGWRGVTGSWPPYVADHPDNAQPLLDIGKGSPTAVDFGYDSNFPAAYREAIYILDWAYGRVLAVHLTPRGGTYRAQAETFLQGSPLNVTGIDFGPDGAMYLVTGGRQTKSALYRVRHVGESTPDESPSIHDVELAEHAVELTEYRRMLESWHRRLGMSDGIFAFRLGPLAGRLADRDPSIRTAAQIALHHQPAALWEWILESEPSRGTLVGLMSIIRSGNSELARPVLERLLPYEFAELEVDLQLTLLHTIALCRKLQPDLSDEFRDELIAQFDPHFPDTSDVLRVSAYGTSVEVERELARLLVELNAPGIVDRCIAELQRSTAQEDRLHYLFLLRDVESGWSEETHRAYFTALREADGFTAGEGMPKFLDLIREAATARLSDAERAQLASLLEPAVEVEPPATIDRPLIQDWTFEELAAAILESSHTPSPERGAEVFQQALCMRCHRVGARGPAVGPDLSFVGRRFSREDILRSIIEPNLVIAENYRNVEVVTADGRLITGRPLTAGDYRSTIVRIAVNPLSPSEIVELPKHEIDVLRESPTSPMPADLLNSFTVEEIIDLLAYVGGGT